MQMAKASEAADQSQDRPEREVRAEMIKTEGMDIKINGIIMIPEENDLLIIAKLGMKGRIDETMFVITKWRKIEGSTIRMRNIIEKKLRKDTNNPSERMIDTIGLMSESTKEEISRMNVIG
jgi:hypothetical protein